MNSNDLVALNYLIIFSIAVIYIYIYIYLICYETVYYSFNL